MLLPWPIHYTDSLHLSGTVLASEAQGCFGSGDVLKLNTPLAGFQAEYSAFFCSDLLSQYIGFFMHRGARIRQGSKQSGRFSFPDRQLGSMKTRIDVLRSHKQPAGCSTTLGLSKLQTATFRACSVTDDLLHQR